VNRTRVILAAGAAAALAAGAALADRDRLPDDFPKPGIVFGGAGGGTSRDDARRLSRCPVVIVPDAGRGPAEWQGAFYDGLRAAGFQPVEIWTIGFAPPGATMTSLEEATDDVKLFLAAVMRYTGADRVQIVGGGTGGLLARLTLLKYTVAHWVAAEVYLDAPFHGAVPSPDPLEALAGHPQAWVVRPGSTLLREILRHGETPRYPDPVLGVPFGLPTLAVAAAPGRAADPARDGLIGAKNVTIAGAAPGTLATSPAAIAACARFLDRPARPYNPLHDRDGDGFHGLDHDGPDFDDGDPAIHPGAPETPGDGIDQDCNGCDLSPARGRDGELRLPPIRARHRR